MEDINALRATFAKIASGRLGAPDNLGKLLKAAARVGLASEDRIASLLNVEEDQLFRAARTLKPREVAALCRRLEG